MRTFQREKEQASVANKFVPRAFFEKNCFRTSERQLASVAQLYFCKRGSGKEARPSGAGDPEASSEESPLLLEVLVLARVLDRLAVLLPRDPSLNGVEPGQVRRRQPASSSRRACAWVEGPVRNFELRELWSAV
eukprot:2347625-Rhodomonas_salina.2